MPEVVGRHVLRQGVVVDIEHVEDEAAVAIDLPRQILVDHPHRSARDPAT